MDSPVSANAAAPPDGCADCTPSSAPSPAGPSNFKLAERVVSLALVLTSALKAGTPRERVVGRVAAAMDGTGMDAAGLRSSAAAAAARRASRRDARLDGVRAI